MGYWTRRLVAEQELGPASGPNPSVDLIAVAVMGFAFGLV